MMRGLVITMRPKKLPVFHMLCKVFSLSGISFYFAMTAATPVSPCVPTGVPTNAQYDAPST